MQCVNCGTALSEGTSFCGRCGARQPGAPLQGPGAAPIDWAGVARKALFMPGILAKLGDGTFFRKFFYLFLVVSGLITAIGGLILSILQAAQIWSPLAGAPLAYLVFLPITLAGVYMMSHTIMLRASHIGVLPDSRYHVARIFVIFLKLVGELGAIALLQWGILGGIAAWAGSARGLGVLGLSGYNSYNGTLFLTGLMLIVAGFVLAFCCLAFFYYLSSLLQVKLDIEDNTRQAANKIQ